MLKARENFAKKKSYRDVNYSEMLLVLSAKSVIAKIDLSIATRVVHNFTLRLTKVSPSKASVSGEHI